jgi:hypothetical protein
LEKGAGGGKTKTIAQNVGENSPNLVTLQPNYSASRCLRGYWTLSKIYF